MATHRWRILALASLLRLANAAPKNSVGYFKQPADTGNPTIDLTTKATITVQVAGFNATHPYNAQWPTEWYPAILSTKDGDSSDGCKNTAKCIQIGAAIPVTKPPAGSDLAPVVEVALANGVTPATFPKAGGSYYLALTDKTGGLVYIRSEAMTFKGTGEAEPTTWVTPVAAASPPAYCSWTPAGAGGGGSNVPGPTGAPGGSTGGGTGGAFYESNTSSNSGSGSGGALVPADLSSAAPYSYPSDPAGSGAAGSPAGISPLRMTREHVHVVAGVGLALAVAASSALWLCDTAHWPPTPPASPHL